MRLGPFDIFEQGLRRLRREFGAALIPMVLGVATLVVGLVSWGIFLADPDNVMTSAKHSDLKGVFHRIVYGALRTVSDFAPSVWNVNEGNYGTDIAALLGAAAFYASVFLIAANLMSETIRKVAARYLYRDHVVIIGATALATRVKEVWRTRARHVVQVLGGNIARPPRGSAQVRSAMDDRMVWRFGLDRAAHVMIDLGDDMATLALAFDLLAARASRGGLTERDKPAADWVLVVRDSTLADHFAESVAKRVETTGASLPNIRYVSPERAVVRRFLVGRPLFLDPQCRAGIHALVIGSGPAVDELIQAIFLTGVVAGRDWPRVTVLGSDPDAERSAFLAGRPGVVGAIDIAFLPQRALDGFEFVARMPSNAAAAASWDRTLQDRDIAKPVNVIFVMNADPDVNSRLAIKIADIRRRTGRLQGNVFGFDASFTEGADRSTQAFGRTIEGYETFGFDDRFLDDEFCTATRRRTLALALHENYRRLSNGPPVPAWDGLPESLRRANGNAADHCLAKLHMLGFDVSQVPSGAIPCLAEGDHRALREALRREPLSGQIRDVVFLEHDRWALERRFDGWVHGTRRDNAKLIHPLLVPWDELSREEQDKDRDQVEALLECLHDKGDRAFELRRNPAEAAALAS